jgi:hypothetical protein
MTALNIALLPQARKNLSNFMLRKADQIARSCGFGYIDSDNAPSVFADLQTAWETSKNTGMPLPVWNGASDKTIYTSAGANFAFRFWHDVLHCVHGLDFTTDAEVKIGHMHIKAVANEFGSNSLECLLMQSDTVEQSKFAQANNGEFPEDQLSFAVEFISRMLQKAA